jgi:hypothetical protein
LNVPFVVQNLLVLGICESSAASVIRLNTVQGLSRKLIYCPSSPGSLRQRRGNQISLI